ncbi:hypothetical protein LB517_28300 [Mesorhizobium sp. BR1-1-12]|uniref:hypothetical protein n=1 Tax=Mesorhizobium sp. BR1-1-12 TaxID=2876657 RepID=UPI001CD072AD|nr:hypothetical protein [Mesorhizobium sp. BR1-1-12]MBZ9973536.1 hypothetical protein [Mesorhizobium sp. BR1-1-12]
MKIVLVFVSLWGGHLSYSEYSNFKTITECQQAFEHLVDLYVADGHDIRVMNGECYWKPIK